MQRIEEETEEVIEEDHELEMTCAMQHLTKKIQTFTLKMDTPQNSCDEESEDEIEEEIVGMVKNQNLDKNQKNKTRGGLFTQQLEVKMSMQMSQTPNNVESAQKPNMIYKAKSNDATKDITFLHDAFPHDDSPHDDASDLQQMQTQISHLLHRLETEVSKQQHLHAIKD